MFRTDLLSIIRSLNTVYTAIGICHAEILKVAKVTSVDWIAYSVQRLAMGWMVRGSNSDGGEVFCT